MAVEFKIVDRFRNRQHELSIHETEHPSFEARLATQLIERWGMVAGEPDGDDAAGRQQIRLLTPSEVVKRAVETAELAADVFRDKGWFVSLPSLVEIEEGRTTADSAA